MTALYAGLGLKLESKRSGLVDALQESYITLKMSTCDSNTSWISVTHGVTDAPHGDRHALGHLQARTGNGRVVVGGLSDTRSVRYARRGMQRRARTALAMSSSSERTASTVQ